jgi:hypothetical protein
MIIKRAIAVESLTKVCEESLNLIKQLIDADNEVYAKGYEDGMAAQADVQKTLRPWVGLTDEDKQDWIKCMPWPPEPGHIMVLIEGIESELKEKNS